MNVNIKNLYTIANKSSKIIIGLMSGTSLDGLDVALCQIKNNGVATEIKLLQFETINYNKKFKDEIKSIFSKKNIDLEKFCVLNPAIALQYAKIINTCLKKWNIKKENVDLIASHGQTIYHAPKNLHHQKKYGNATLQIGDGDHLAMATGIITISDFRQKHIAAGGEGAPLAVYGDYLILGKQNKNSILLNIGGIANFTFLPSSKNNSFNIISSDTGPGNTLMDAFIQKNNENIYFDKDAKIAIKGKINLKLLDCLLKNSFFKKPFPKTTGPELFNLEYLNNALIKSNTIDISVNDIMATLNKFTALTIAKAIKKTIGTKTKVTVFLSGGGIHNPLLMQHLKDLLPKINFCTTDKLNINPDAKEAMLFAILANECVSGNNNYFKKNSNQMPNVFMGKVSFPY